MAAPRHTPGPWRIGYTRAFDADMGEHGHTLNLVIGDRIIPLISAGVGNCPDDYEEWKANARLMAQAPKMLEALNKLEESIEDWASGWEINKLRALIAEAKGEV